MIITPNDDSARRIEHLESELQRLEERINRAEQTIRKGFYTIGFLVLGGLFTIVAGRAVTSGGIKSLEAGRFILRDSDGKMRALLDITPKNCPILAFYDQNGINVLQVFAWHDGSAGINVLDTSGKVRVAIGGTRDGTMGFAIYDASGRMRVENSLKTDGSAGLTIYDRDSKPSFQIPQR